MLRDKNLVPLSRQHQHALALCVRIDRAAPIPESDLAAWQTEIAEHFRSEIRIHFAAEEKVLFPEGRTFHELAPLVDELLTEHADLRDRFARAGASGMSAAELGTFAQKLSTHIRKEERLFFEQLQELMTQEELALIGEKLSRAIVDATQACILPARSRPAP
jgi:iron-sulfur cluster repair protein YtfE (RIC family)